MDSHQISNLRIKKNEASTPLLYLKLNSAFLFVICKVSLKKMFSVRFADGKSTENVEGISFITSNYIRLSCVHFFAKIHNQIEGNSGLAETTKRKTSLQLWNSIEKQTNVMLPQKTVYLFLFLWVYAIKSKCFRFQPDHFINIHCSLNKITVQCDNLDWMLVNICKRVKLYNAIVLLPAIF